MKRRLCLLVLVVVVALLVGAPPASASEVTVPTTVEAWYAALPPVPPRPAGTLHVGSTGGLEDSRTYLALDLSGISPDDEVTGGVLSLPVDAADSQAPDTATIDVCLAGSPGPAVDGSTAPPPPVDCSIHSPAKYAAGVLTADLAPFNTRLRTNGLALVPRPAGAATWHVAFWRRDNKAPAAKPITATLVLRDPPGPATTTAPSGPEQPLRGDVAEEATPAFDTPLFASPGAGFASVEPFELPPAAVAQEEFVPVPHLGPPMTRAIPAAAAANRYGGTLLFTLPLVLLAFAGYAGSALTRPVLLPARAGGGEAALTRPVLPLPSPGPDERPRGRRRVARARGLSSDG